MTAPSSPASREQGQVRKRRYLEARSAGLTRVEARLFADSETDVRWLRKLVEGKATPDQMCRILL